MTLSNVIPSVGREWEKLRFVFFGVFSDHAEPELHAEALCALGNVLAELRVEVGENC